MVRGCPLRAGRAKLILHDLASLERSGCSKDGELC